MFKLATLGSLLILAGVASAQHSRFSDKNSLEDIQRVVRYLSDRAQKAEEIMDEVTLDRGDPNDPSYGLVIALESVEDLAQEALKRIRRFEDGR